MEEGLVAALLAHPGLAAWVGRRIYWEQRPQGDLLPALVLHIIDRVPTYAGDGDAELDATRVQINCLATDRQDASGNAQTGRSIAILVARQVRAALSEVEMQSGVTFQGVFPEDIDQNLQPEQVAGVTVYGRSLDYQFWHLT